uniref:Uncharacterized protein n=1 Tax=Panagrolaimus sp. ES5 TaxID=591445 RepID=A0AC34FK46_9BILA
MVAGAVAWFCYCTFQDLKKNDKKKDLKKPHKKNDDRKGISAGDLEAALEKKVTKDGDCLSCRERLAATTPKKKTPTKIPSIEESPVAAGVAEAVIPGLDASFATIKSSPVNFENLKPVDSTLGTSFGTIKSDDGNSSWDKLSLPPTPKKHSRDVPPTPSNSLTILLKNKKKEAKSESATLSSDCQSDKDMEKTQDDL